MPVRWNRFNSNKWNEEEDESDRKYADGDCDNHLGSSFRVPWGNRKGCKVLLTRTD